MYTISAGNMSYQLPLDDIDLGFIQRNIQIGDNIKPLWTPQEKEYFYFQINASRREAEDEKRDEISDVTITTMCHICKMPVPIIYMEKHNNGVIHKMLRKIIHEALERVKDNINKDPALLSETQLSTATFYCDVCCTGIPNTEKDTHEKSPIHKKMRKELNILYKFCMFFEKANANNDSTARPNDSNNNLVRKDEITEVTTKLGQLEKYVKSLNKINSSLEIEVLDENFISIKSNGSNVKVHIDNFHSFDIYNLAGDSELVCLLCKSIVSSKEHIWSDMHMKNVMLPLIDEHCMRKINQNQAHCIICNELIKNVDLHKQTDVNHKIKLKNAQVSKVTCPFSQAIVTKLPETNQDVQNASNSTSDKEDRTLVMPKLKEDNNTNDSSQSNDNKENGKIGGKMQDTVPKVNKAEGIIDGNLKTNGKEISKSDKLDDRSTKFMHYLISDTPNPKEVICKLCLCVIPALVNIINDHLKGKRHLNKYDECLSTNKINKLENGFACDFCRLHVKKGKEITHVFSEAHKFNTVASVKFNFTYCESCLIYVDTPSIESHRNGLKHQKNVTKNDVSIENKNYAQVAAKIKNKTDSDKSNKADVRSTSTNNSDNSSIRESDNSKNIQTSELKSIQSVNVDIPYKLSYQLKKISPTTVQCKVCDETLNNSTDHVINHLSNAKHSSKYENLLKKNEVRKAGLNFHCHKCNVLITRKNELDHIFGTKHRIESITASISEVNKNLSSIKNPPLSTVSVEPSTSKVNIGKNNTVKKTDHHFIKSLGQPGQVKCRICKTIMMDTITNKTSHVESYRHKTLYEILLKNNRLIRLEGNNFFVYCEACELDISLENELQHIEDVRHMDLLYLE